MINEMNLGRMIIKIYDDTHTPISQWTFHNIFFLGSESLSLAYSSNDMVKYAINFGTDYIVYEDVGISNTEEIDENNYKSKGFGFFFERRSFLLILVVPYLNCIPLS